MTEYIMNRQYDIANGTFSTVKREKIVRCRDCVNYEPDLYEHFNCELLTHYAKPDDFCAWGERKS